MKHYYALFKETAKAVEVEFPDLPGCVTFGKDWDEAIENAIDALGGWLAHAEPEFIKQPSSHKKLESKIKGMLIPIPVDERIVESYQASKRFNVIFPLAILHRIDSFRRKKGVKRSTFLLHAAEEYLARHHAAA
jgi:predicted RNase H-like HicB family nuclease